MDPDERTEWLLDGDPAIRWQVMRDLLDAPASEYEAERERVAETGWGRQLLDEQDDDGRWAGDETAPYRGLYSPKWTSTTYTLLLLRHFGIDPDHPAAHAGCRAIVDGATWGDDGHVRPWASDAPDACVSAMILGLFEYFDHDAPDRRDALLDALLAERKPDVGWNCDTDSSVSSVHTTISTVEALRHWLANRQEVSKAPDAPDASETSATATVADAMAGGHEYLLERELFRSLSTGEPIKVEFTRFSFPPRWYYDVLRGFEQLRAAGADPDTRAADAIELVHEKQRPDGTWPLQNHHAGREYFRMEQPGEPSRWNTLRALRVLRWWEA